MSERIARHVEWDRNDELTAGAIVGRALVEDASGNYVADGLVVEFAFLDGTGGDFRAVYFDRAARVFRMCEVRR